MGLFNRKSKNKDIVPSTPEILGYEPRTLYLMRHGPNIIKREYWSDSDSNLLDNVARRIGRHIMENYDSPKSLDIFATNTYRTAITADTVAKTLAKELDLEVINHYEVPKFSLGGKDNSRGLIMSSDAYESIHTPSQPTLVVAHESSPANLSRGGASDYHGIWLQPAQVIFIRNDEEPKILKNDIID